jgi:hypothetical protein
MPSKIFISYRREDSAANALGIGQYLEHQFGRKNVFIDVDMRAGIKFPEVLERRLAECKVMLVLIGPEWLNARDKQGHRRLDNSDDWVRLEIARALKRNITVVPVRINGTELPPKEELPNDIQALLDHQAASVTTAGFRHEMSGLAHDIRSIPGSRRWRPITAVAGILLLLTMFAITGFPNMLVERVRSLFPQTSRNAKLNGIWSGYPGEWVLYEIGNQRFAHYFNPSSVKKFGDRVSFRTRMPLESTNATAPDDKTMAYEEDSTVVDCKKSIWAMAEKTVYSKTGEVVSHLRWGEPESLDLSIGGPVQPSTVVSTAEHIMCNEQLRTPILSKEQIAELSRQKIANTNLSYLSATPNGDGEIFDGQKKTIPNSADLFESLLVMKFYADQPFAALFPGQTLLGLPPSYRTRADHIQLDCSGKKVQFLETDYFDSENNLTYLAAPITAVPIDIKERTPLAQLLNIGCPGVGGTYEGTNEATYKNGGQGDQKISITVKQNGSDVSITFQTASGGQGSGAGTLTGSVVNSISLQSTAPECPGSYEGSLNFTGDTMSWSFKGQDCGGPMEGHGTAKRTKV